MVFIRQIFNSEIDKKPFFFLCTKSSLSHGAVNEPFKVKYSTTSICRHRVFTVTTMFNLLVVFKNCILEILQLLLLTWRVVFETALYVFEKRTYTRP